MKLFLDTNILLDYLLERENFDSARLLFLLGILKEVTLFSTTAQANDLLYMLGGKLKRGIDSNYRQALIKMTSFVNFVPLSADNFKSALESNWTDIEDACVWQVAKSVCADAIITRDKQGFINGSIPTMTADEWFENQKSKGINYQEMLL